MVFAVITKVPPLTEGGNLAIPSVPLIEEVETMAESNGWKGKYKPVNFGLAILSARQPVFKAGEIVILDSEYGREIVYPQRKPSKWDVEVENFDTIEKAVERSNEITSSDDYVDVLTESAQ